MKVIILKKVCRIGILSLIIIMLLSIPAFARDNIDNTKKTEITSQVDKILSAGELTTSTELEIA